MLGSRTHFLGLLLLLLLPQPLADDVSPQGLPGGPGHLRTFDDHRRQLFRRLLHRDAEKIFREKNFFVLFWLPTTQIGAVTTPALSPSLEK